MPRVLNKYKDVIPPDAVYIGRPTKWGNPYAMLNPEDRPLAIQRYREYLDSHPELVEQAKRELRDKDLVCFCAPKPCHGDILLELVNQE